MAVDDAAIRMSLDYLFSVVMECSLRASADFDDVQDMLRQSRRSQNLIICGEHDKCLKLIKYASTLPQVQAIIVLDQQADETFGVNAFRNGAIDVIRPPFGLKEIALRLKLRIGEAPELGGLDQKELDWEAEAYFANEARLTTAEAQVARVLIRHDGEIVTRDELSQMIDHQPWKYGDRKFDVHVAKIRKKFQAAFGSRIEVKTVRSAGYKLTVLEGDTSKKSSGNASSFGNVVFQAV